MTADFMFNLFKKKPYIPNPAIMAGLERQRALHVKNPIGSSFNYLGQSFIVIDLINYDNGFNSDWIDWPQHESGIIAEYADNTGKIHRKEFLHGHPAI